MKNIPKKQFAGWMLMLLLCISISAFAQSPKKGDRTCDGCTR